MNNIPKSLNDDMNTDPFYRHCCLRRFGGCGGRNIYGRTIERHHAFIYAGRQVQAKFCILPACPDHHGLASRPDIKELFDWVLLNRASDEELQSFSRTTPPLLQVRERLNKKLGVWKQ